MHPLTEGKSESVKSSLFYNFTQNNAIYYGARCYYEKRKQSNKRTGFNETEDDWHCIHIFENRSLKQSRKPEENSTRDK